MIFHKSDNQIIRHTYTERTRAPCNKSWPSRAIFKGKHNGPLEQLGSTHALKHMIGSAISQKRGTSELIMRAAVAEAAPWALECEGKGRRSSAPRVYVHCFFKGDRSGNTRRVFNYRSRQPSCQPRTALLQLPRWGNEPALSPVAGRVPRVLGPLIPVEVEWPASYCFEPVAAVRAACQTRATPRKETRPKARLMKLAIEPRAWFCPWQHPNRSGLIDPFSAQSDTNCLTLRESSSRDRRRHRPQQGQLTF